MDILSESKTELENWLNNSFNREFMFERTYHDLTRSLDDNLKNHGVVLESLSSLAYWYGASGTFKMPSDKQGAGSDFHNMFFCDFLQAKFALKLYQESQKPSLRAFFNLNKTNNPRFFFDAHAKLLANALSFGFIKEAAEIGEIILRLLNDNMYYGLNSLTHPRFILEIFCVWKKFQFPSEKFSIDIPQEYRRLVNEIEDKDANRFNSLISDAYDYHLLKSGEDTDDENKEFFNPVYILFATEILAAYQIRKLLNKSVVEETPILIRDYLDIEKIIKNTEVDCLFKNISEKIETL